MKKAIIAAILLTAVAGCIRPARITPPVVYKTATPDELLSAYNANVAMISTLTADLQMVFYREVKGRSTPYRVSAWLDIEKPGKLRLAHDSIGRELFYIVSDGERFWIGLDSALTGDKDTVYAGTLSALSRESFLRPDRLLAAFSLAPLPPSGTADTVLESYPDRYVLVFIDGAVPRRILSKATFGRATLMLSGFEVFDEECRPALVIKYQSYKAVSGAQVPDSLYISWPLDKFSVQAKVRDIKVGVPIPARRWQFKWRPQAEVIDIDNPALPQPEEAVPETPAGASEPEEQERSQ